MWIVLLQNLMTAKDYLVIDMWDFMLFFHPISNMATLIFDDLLRNDVSQPILNMLVVVLGDNCKHALNT